MNSQGRRKQFKFKNTPREAEGESCKKKKEINNNDGYYAQSWNKYDE